MRTDLGDLFVRNTSPPRVEGERSRAGRVRRAGRRSAARLANQEEAPRRAPLQEDVRIISGRRFVPVAWILVCIACGSETTPARRNSDNPVDAGAKTVVADEGVLPASCTSVVDGGAPETASMLLADSEVGFSSRQGFCSWTYGYQEPDDAELRLMKDWDGSGDKWFVAREEFWTLVSACAQHPNGALTSSGRESSEQWSVRRWTSTIDGDVIVSGIAHKHPGGLGGNGVDVRIVVDDAVAYARFIDGTDAVGESFEVPATVTVGSTLDFVVDPHESDDNYDSTIFTARIWLSR
jgi:hypothetical protein